MTEHNWIIPKCFVQKYFYLIGEKSLKSIIMWLRSVKQGNYTLQYPFKRWEWVRYECPNECEGDIRQFLLII